MSIAELFNNKEDSSLPFSMNLTVGVVTSIEDKDGLGRVKVRLLNRGTSDIETGFIRVMTPMAGKEWGMFFFPEVNDEVVVGFFDGDISSPVVLGSLWNSNNTIPQKIESNDKNYTRLIKTKSGHTVSFYDEDGKGVIEIKTGGEELNVKLEDEKKAMTVSDKDGKNLIKIDADKGEISITADKKITLQADKSTVTISSNIEMKNNGDIKLDGNKIALNAKSEVAAEGKSAVNLKASGQLNLEASGIANLKGGMVKIN